MKLSAIFILSSVSHRVILSQNITFSHNESENSHTESKNYFLT